MSVETKAYLQLFTVVCWTITVSSLLWAVINLIRAEIHMRKAIKNLEDLARLARNRFE